MRSNTILDYLDSQLYCNKIRVLYGLVCLLITHAIIYSFSTVIVNHYGSISEISYVRIGRRKQGEISQYHVDLQRRPNHYATRQINRKLLNSSASEKRKIELNIRINEIKYSNEQYQYIQPQNATVYDLMFMKPIQYLRNYINPCFAMKLKTQSSNSLSGETISNSVKKEFALKCLPGFYVAGFTKCATTDVHARLSLHQHVTYGWTKEPHWWDNYHGADSTLFRYADMFEEATRLVHERISIDDLGVVRHPVLIGDFTPRTAWHGDDWTRDVLNKDLDDPLLLIPQKMKHVTPGAKIVFMIRNAVDRLYSDYLDMMVRHNADTQDPTPDDFHAKVSAALVWWQQCISSHTERACAYGYPDGMPLLDSSNRQQWYSQAADRLRIGLYSIFIEEWLSVFEEKQLLFISFQIYSHNPVLTIERDILPFLGLEPFDDTAIEQLQGVSQDNHLNSRKIRVSPALDVPMLDKTRTLLNEFYKPYNDRLKYLLGDEFAF